MSRFSGTLPAEKSFKQWTNVDRAKRNRYWSAVREMRQEYTEEFKGVYDLTTRPTIHYWAEEKYGFRMHIDSYGNYADDFTIVNDKKFMLFQIRYWK